MATKKLNIIVRGRNWLYTLLGKTPPVNQTDNENTLAEPETPQEDSIVNDINTFKAFAKKGIDKTKVIVSPFAKKGATTAVDATKAVTSSVDNKHFKLLMRVLLVLFFSIILVFTAVYLFRKLKEGNGITQTGTTSVTPVPFSPYKPSVYAQDAEILKLEEDVNILERELSTVKIKEDGINPPRLDFDISF